MAQKKRPTNKPRTPDTAAGHRRARLPPLLPLTPVSGAERQALGLPEWAMRSEWPHTYGKKEEHDFEKNRNLLFSDKAFRDDILLYKQKYPQAYWEKVPSLKQHADSFFEGLLTAWVVLCERYEKELGPNVLTAAVSPVTLWADLDAYHLCQKWGLDPWDFRWIKWLGINWDIEREPVPLSEPPVPLRPDFSPCRIFTEEGLYVDSRVPRKMILELKPGVTRKGAQRALDAVFDRFEVEVEPDWLKERKKPVRPGLTQREQMGLNKIFSAIPIPTRQRGQQAKAIRQAIEQARDSNLDIGDSTIAREYRLWLAGQGRPPAKYKKLPN
ncbi:MAG: hypothetical protein H6750_04595 [Nitrospiraceae bacterium]|nr:hypothetical protein [Nitrospira sp.]MCB9773586.1 hypothetical protein [Nitrospiraceae bacterium]